MSTRQKTSALLSILLVILVISLLIGGWLGQPILVGYVTTDSMSPTLDPGDGFIAIPEVVTGSVTAGDVITFQAEVLHDGGLTTHRVVAQTDNGYITKGDNNPVTDQSGSGEPPVRQQQIVATALQINDYTIVVPEIGHLVTESQSTTEYIQYRLAGLLGTRLILGTQGLTTLIGILMLGLYVLDVAVTSTRKQKVRNRAVARDRDTGKSSRKIVLFFTLILLTATTLGMIAPSTQHEFRTLQSSTEEATLHVTNSAALPVVVYLTPGSEKIRPDRSRIKVSPRSTEAVSVYVKPPSGRQDYRRFLDERRYFALLPAGMQDKMYKIHPWVPIIVIGGAIATMFYVISVRFLGKSRIRARGRS